MRPIDWIWLGYTTVVWIGALCFMADTLVAFYSRRSALLSPELLLLIVFGILTWMPFNMVVYLITRRREIE